MRSRKKVVTDFFTPFLFSEPPARDTDIFEKTTQGEIAVYLIWTKLHYAVFYHFILNSNLT